MDREKGFIYCCFHVRIYNDFHTNTKSFEYLIQTQTHSYIYIKLK